MTPRRLHDLDTGTGAEGKRRPNLIGVPVLGRCHSGDVGRPEERPGSVLLIADQHHIALRKRRLARRGWDQRPVTLERGKRVRVARRRADCNVRKQLSEVADVRVPRRVSEDEESRDRAAIEGEDQRRLRRVRKPRRAVTASRERVPIRLTAVQAEEVVIVPRPEVKSRSTAGKSETGDANPAERREAVRQLPRLSPVRAQDDAPVVCHPQRATGTSDQADPTDAGAVTA